MQVSVTEVWGAIGPMATFVLLVLATMSILSINVAVEKWIAIRRAARESARFLRAWRGSSPATPGVSGDPADYPHSHVAAVVAAGTRVLASPIGAARLDALDRVTRGARLATLGRLRRGMGLLATVGSTAPFVGLFGTVVGIINAFRQMAQAGHGGLGVVSAGIAEALVATAAGLLVAIPALWLFNYLTQRIAGLGTEMECVAEELAVTAVMEGRPDGVLAD
jgi:biopolymer transport protein ExbB/TolQ